MNDLFTWPALGSLTGASAATLLTANVVGGLLGPAGDKARKWIALGVALALSYLTAAFATDVGAEKWIIAFFNGLIIFSAALGINQLPPGNRQATQASPSRIAQGGGEPRYIRSWV
ncbi:hypothetical protein FHX75_11404 [Micromonospora palomenae]|uniref:Uncharacterized protein n=1 Tax=Micromonospora palomenae TaxID=1461247 RepID=A0A561WTU0_9ACTN|nr:hypothetical protein [Micromonospora palomenae]TWG27269.1 hypothetical protein FHX75_11404 [Micromonospora palomenae]